MVVASGQRTVLKQGSKIPVMTGTSQAGAGAQTQFQYLDIGMNFDATLEDSPNGLRLKTKVEQSALGNPSEFGNGSGPLAQEPIVHQTSLEGSSIITPANPLPSAPSTSPAVPATSTSRSSPNLSPDPTALDKWPPQKAPPRGASFLRRTH